MSVYAAESSVAPLRKAALIGLMILIGLGLGLSCVLLPPGAMIGIVALPALFLLWALPDLALMSNRIPKWLLFVFLASAMAIPNYAALILPGMPWISARKIAVNAFAATFSLSLAVSSANRAYTLQIMRKQPLLLGFLICYFALQIIILPVSADPSISMITMINTTMIWWMPLVAAVTFLRSPKSVIGILVCIVVCMLFDTLMGVIEFYLKRPFLIYALPPSMREQMFAAFPMYAGLLTVGLRNGLYRAYSIFNNGLSYGEFAMMNAPIAAYFLFDGQSSKSRVFGLLCLGCSFASIFVSGSRGAYVGFTASMIVYLVLWSFRYAKFRPDSLLGSFALVLYSMGAVAALLSIEFVGFVHRTVLGGGEVQGSNDVRSIEWSYAMPKVWQSPIWGHGPGVAAQVVGYTNMSGDYVIDSYGINLLVDTGFVGTFLFIGMIVITIHACFRIYFRGRSALSAAAGSIGCSLIGYSFYRTTLSQTENNSVAYVLIGLTFVIAYLTEETPHVQRR